MKYFLTLILTTLFFVDYAQDKFDTYTSTYFSNDYEIKVSSENEKKYKLYIDFASMDRLHNKAGIILTQKTHPKFLESISLAKEKYVEWVKTAKANSIDELSKEMDLKSDVNGYFLYGNDWHFDYMTTLEFAFRILKTESDELQYLLIVRTGGMTASDNQFMKVEGGVMAFTTEGEIIEFIDSISIDKVVSFVSKPKAVDLFK